LNDFFEGALMFKGSIGFVFLMK